MAGTQDLIDAIVENGTSGKKIQVTGVADATEFHTLRTALVRKWTEHREVIVAIAGDSDPLAKLSLCADYSEEDRCASFYLGKSRRKQAKSYSFSIVSDDAPDATSGVTDDDKLPPRQYS